MTVAQLLDSMTLEEYMRWNAFFEDRELARERADKRARGVVDFSDPQAATTLIGLVKAGGK